MKRIIITTTLVLVSAIYSYAGTPIPLTELPDSITKVIAEYFPGSSTISAERDQDDGNVKYEVRIQYKAIKLEVDVSPDGKILDVDMED